MKISLIDSFVKAVNQLSDPSIRQTLLLSILLAIVVFALLWSVIGWLLGSTQLFEWGWLETIVDVLGGIATLALTWLLFPAVLSAVMALFLDRVAQAVEDRHYPNLGRARDVPLGESLVGALKFLGILVGLNFIALFFLFIPPLFPIVFYAVNGYLLSREYFELVGHRRAGLADVTSLRKAHGVKLFIAGVGMAFLLTIPIVNLLTPLIATGVMVHLYHAMASRNAGTAMTSIT
ncbi:MAG: EI24 domain-containing protein [Magnetovibrionaceae bacterium]